MYFEKVNSQFSRKRVKENDINDNSNESLDLNINDEKNERIVVFESQFVRGEFDVDSERDVKVKADLTRFDKNNSVEMSFNEISEMKYDDIELASIENDDVLQSVVWKNLFKFENFVTKCLRNVYFNDIAMLRVKKYIFKQFFIRSSWLMISIAENFWDEICILFFACVMKSYCRWKLKYKFELIWLNIDLFVKLIILAWATSYFNKSRSSLNISSEVRVFFVFFHLLVAVFSEYALNFVISIAYVYLCIIMTFTSKRSDFDFSNSLQNSVFESFILSFSKRSRYTNQSRQNCDFRSALISSRIFLIVEDSKSSLKQFFADSFLISLTTFIVATAISIFQLRLSSVFHMSFLIHSERRVESSSLKHVQFLFMWISMKSLTFEKVLAICILWRHN